MWNQTITHHRQTARTDHPSPPPPPASTVGGRLKGGLHPLRTPQQTHQPLLPSSPRKPRLPGLTDVTSPDGLVLYSEASHRSIGQSARSFPRASPPSGEGEQKKKTKQTEGTASHTAVNTIRTAKRAAPSRRALVTWKTVGRWSNLYRDNVLSTEERKVENPFIYFVLPIKRALRHTVGTDG